MRRNRHPFSSPSPLPSFVVLAGGFLAIAVSAALMSPDARVTLPSEPPAAHSTAGDPCALDRPSSIVARPSFSSPSSTRPDTVIGPGLDTSSAARGPIHPHTSDPALSFDNAFAARLWLGRGGDYPLPSAFPYPAELSTIAEAARANGLVTAEDWAILLAIRCSENGRPGRQFGVMAPRAVDTDLRTQAGWAAATVVKNRARFNAIARAKAETEVHPAAAFIAFLAARYCPAAADPEGHKNWNRNVTYFNNKFYHEEHEEHEGPR